MTAVELDSFTNLVVVAVSLFFVAIKFNQLIGLRPVWRQFDPRSTGLWLFSLCLGLGLLLRSETVYTWFDARLGINNLAWLISCTLLTLSLWVMVESCQSIYNDFYRIRKIITGGLIVAETIIVLVFRREIAPAPEHFYPGSIIPQNGAEVVIKSVMLSYAAMTTLLATWVYYRLFRRETVLAARIRWFLIMGIVVDATLMLLIRIVLTLSYFFSLPPSILVVLKIITWITQVVLMFWPLIFLPARSRVYRTLARPVDYIQKLYILRNLFALQRACERLSPGLLSSPALSSPLHWQECLSHTDRCVYKLLIAILDYKNELQEFFRPGPAWLTELLTVNDNVDYATQIHLYSQLGKRLLKEARFF